MCIRDRAIRQENNDQLDSIKGSLNCKFSDFHKTVENVKNQCNSQAEKLDNLQQIQTNLQGDVDRISSRSACSSPHVYQDSKESVIFRDYRRNPLEFLGRVDEILNRSKENRWNMIKGILDESFKNINDNWWTAIRNEVCDYGGFKTMFKLKYLSLIHIYYLVMLQYTLS